MAYNIPDLNDVEKRFRRVLRAYAEATTRCDLLETLFAMHTALEDALKAYLHQDRGFGTSQIAELSFWEKAEEALPGSAGRDFELSRLHGHRSNYAHPRRPYDPDQMKPFTNEEIRETAVGLAEFVSAHWRDLFGSPPPRFDHPPLPPRKLAGLKDLPASVMKTKVVKRLTTALEGEMAEVERLGRTIDGKDAEIKALKRRLTGREVRAGLLWGRDVRWFGLFVGLLALLPLPWLLGVATSLRVERPLAWYWLLIPGLPALVLAFYALRGLLRFVHSVGMLRLLAALSTLLVIATAALAPFTDGAEGWAGTAGAAFGRILDAVTGAVEGYTTIAYREGEALTTMFLFAGGSDGEATAAETASAYPTPTSGPPTATPSRQAGSLAAGEAITVGVQVAVSTDGSRLLCRAEPGLDASPEMRLEDGATASVVDGPVEADGYVWWKVETDDGAGWSAARFLTPVVDR